MGRKSTGPRALDPRSPHLENFFSVEREIDLFGNPVRAGHGAKGRPRYEPTQKDRNKVKLLLAMGWGNQRIANALSVSLQLEAVF